MIEEEQSVRSRVEYVPIELHRKVAELMFKNDREKSEIRFSMIWPLWEM